MAKMPTGPWSSRMLHDTSPGHVITVFNNLQCTNCLYNLQCTNCLHVVSMLFLHGEVALTNNTGFG